MRIKSVAVIGAGKLGEPVIRRLVEDQICRPEDIFISRKNKAKLPELVSKFPDCRICSCNCEAVDQAGVIILAVKPDDLDAVAAELRGKINSEQAIFSVITGKSMAELARKLGTRRIFRASTSILLETKNATTFYLYSSRLNRIQQYLCKRIVESWGEVARVKKEDILEVGIALSGSEPGLYSRIVQCIIEGFEGRGLPGHQVRKLIFKSHFFVSAKFLKGETSPAEMVARIKTPGGITAAGLEFFAENKLEEIVKGSIEAVMMKIKKL